MRYALLIGVMLLAGCASTQSKESAFSDVAATVAERTNMQIHWDQGTDADRQVVEAVHAMLQKELTVDDAVQIALLNNRNLQATYEDLGIARSELVQAGLLRNPTLSAQIRFPGRPKSPLEIDVTEEFLSMLLLPVRKRLAGAAFDSAKLQVTDAVLNMISQTKAAFYTLQGAEQLIEMRQSVLLATEASADAAMRMHDAGNITDLQLANEEALHGRAKLDLADAEADMLDAREQLNAAMGVWGLDTTWKIAARLPELPTQDIDLAGLESLAMSQRLDLAAARQDIEVMAQHLGLMRASALIPEAAIASHYERESDGSSTAGPGIEIPIPIFDQGRAAVAGGQARLRQSQQRYAALAVEIRSQVRRARNRTMAAASRARYLTQVILPLRHSIVEETQLEYNGMLVGVFELLRTKQEEIDAGRQYIETLRDYWIARTELERVVGGRLEGRPATTPLPTQSTAPETSAQPAAQEHHHDHGG